MIAVVIPYFQREGGILRRSLASIQSQADFGMPIHVIVVDDASPHPADLEVDGFGKDGMTLQVIKQANGGPGAARNEGLRNVPAGTRYVAFLDSDDEWSNDHLCRAVAALELGHDFYFANLFQLGQSIDGFSRAGRIVPSQHPSIECPHAGLHRYAGDMFDQIVRGNVIGTSTVVYAFERYPEVRFRVDLTRAGEDYLFWMALVKAGVRIAFSAKVEATYGKGVNVYSGAVWASDEFFIRVRHEMTYRKATQQLFDLSVDQRKHLAACIAELRDAFAGAVLHRWRHGPRFSQPLLTQQVSMDIASLWSIPRKAMQLVLRRS